ncbi:hypothetical protein FGO68_gene6976 [Halteria grandinella]|uniref:Uncharacterized protein n=1 Tax=Halteria grandinella TaxID=5974 RepID=A0A8J8P7B8_HALGN|nr:hypothetical protein FGO68_gene6976 [Halteria grandinella]
MLTQRSLCTFLTLASVALAQSTLLPTFLKAGEIYENIELTLSTQLSVRALVNLTGITRYAYMTQYVVVSLDTDEDFSLHSKYLSNPASDPKLYIRKLPYNIPPSVLNATFANFSAFPASGIEQIAQTNFTSAPKILPLTKSMLNGGGIVEVLVTCREACKFALKVTPVLINQVTSLDMMFNVNNRTFVSNKRSFQINEPRSFNVFQVDIPPLIQNITLRNKTSYLNIADSLQLEVESDAIARTSIDLYNSYQGDDFYSSMDFTKDQNGLNTDTGKILHIPFDPNNDGYLYDFCLQRGCTFFFVVRARNPLKLTVSARLFLKDQLLLQDSVPNNRALSQSSASIPEQCWPFYIEKSLTDVSIMINTYSGDETQWAVYQRDYDIGYNNLLISTDPASSHQIIVRSSDIWRQGEPPANKLIYICATKVLVETSVSILPISKNWFQQLNLTEETLTSFNLDSKDYLSFIYTNDFLSMDQYSQNLSLFLATQTSLKMQSVPRQLYTVCQYANSADCFLTAQQAMSITTMTAVNGQSDDLSKTRLSVINHQPSACPYYTSCHYLMSVFNPDSFGPIKVSLRISSTFQKQSIINVFSQIQSASVDYGRYQFYQIKFTPQQLTTLAFTKLIIKTQAYSGSLVLYCSTTQINPSYTNGYEQMSIAKQRFNFLEYDLSNASDLSSFRLYLGVYGTEQTYFKLLVDADYTFLYPQIFKSPETQLSANQILLSQLDPSLLLADMPSKTYINITGQNPAISVYYKIPTDQVQTILFQQKIDRFNGNVSMIYNVSNIADNGTIIGSILNQAIPLVLYRNGPLGGFISTSILRFDFRLLVSGILSPSTPWDLVNSFMRVQLGILCLQTEQRTFQQVEGDLFLGQTVTGYGFSDSILYRKILMDSQAQYQFSLTNLLGSYTYLLIKIGDPFKRLPIQFKDDYSYDYAKSNLIFQETVNITIDQQMRNKTNRFCANGTYPLAGGNENCTMYVAVHCLEICAFNLSVSVIGNRSNFLNVSEPALIKEGTQLTDSVSGSRMKYYFFPFNRNTKAPNDTFLVVSKISNDVFVNARVVNNSHLPFQNWTYPKGLNTTYNFISQSGSSTNEVLVVQSQEMLKFCRFNNTSCTLVIGVNGTGPANSTSLFQLQMLQRSKMLTTNNKTINGYIPKAGQYEHYWVLINTRNITNKGILSERFKWQYVLAAGTQTLGMQVDLVGGLISPQLPSIGSSDYLGAINGPDMLNVTSEDVILANRTNGRWAILVIGVYANKNETKYSLMCWGPFEYGRSALNMTDLTLDRVEKVVFDQRMIQNESSFLQPNKMFRFFNYGTRDLRFTFNISNTTRGSVYILANNQPFRSEIAPNDTFEGALQGSIIQTYQGILPGYSMPNRNLSQNPFLNIPLYNTTSLIAPLIFKPNSTLNTFDITMNNPQNGLWCQFCWIYLTVIPTSLQANQTKAQMKNITVNITVKEIQDGGQFVDKIIPNKRGSINQMLSLAGSVMQRKFLLESFDPFILNISEKANGYITVYLTSYTVYLADQAKLWTSQGTGPQVLVVNSTDTRFQLGVWYYITVVAGATQQNVSINLYQDKQISPLKNNTITVGRMKNREDIVKYYQMPLLNPTFNYSAQVTVKAKSAGFQPIVYAQKNDMLNSTLAGELVYPSPYSFTFKFEKPFFQSLQQAFVFTINVTSTTQTPYLTYNQTYYTLCMHWTNFGFTDQFETEFTIETIIRPLRPSLTSSRLTQCEEKEEGSMIRIGQQSHKFGTIKDGLTNKRSKVDHHAQ